MKVLASVLGSAESEWFQLLPDGSNIPSTCAIILRSSSVFGWTG